MSAVPFTSTPHREPGLFAVWYPIIGPLAAWGIHLVGESALVRAAQKHHSVIWAMHGLTAAMGLAALIGIVIAYRLTRAGEGVEGGERSGTTAGWTAFMGWIGLISASFNFLLIVAEELVIVWVKLHA
jgi:hypothetical protein